jgi:hypothetical protein
MIIYFTQTLCGVNQALGHFVERENTISCTPVFVNEILLHVQITFAATMLKLNIDVGSGLFFSYITSLFSGALLIERPADIEEGESISKYCINYIPNNVLYIKILLDCDWLISVQLISNSNAIICNNSVKICNNSAKICNNSAKVIIIIIIIITVPFYNCSDRKSASSLSFPSVFWTHQVGT